MNSKKLLAGAEKTELTRLAQDILVMLDDRAAGEDVREKPRAPFARVPRRNDYFGVATGGRVPDGYFGTLSGGEAGRAGGVRPQDTAYGGGERNPPTTADVVFGGVLSVEADSLESKAPLVGSFGEVTDKRADRPMHGTEISSAARGAATVSKDADSDTAAAKKAGEALTDSQELGQSRLPERVSELFCRDSRRYDGAFVRY